MRLQGCRCHEIADRSAEFNEQIAIIVLSAFIANIGAEERHAGNTEGVQHWTTVAQDVQDVVASKWHADILLRPLKDAHDRQRYERPAQ